MNCGRVDNPTYLTFTFLDANDNVEKFDPNSDKGTFLRYSNASKAYRVYKFRTFIVEESINVKFNDSKLDNELSELNNSISNLNLEDL
ncbi:hypothetical protein CR513_14317, partial [Mucuna pruriens]